MRDFDAARNRPAALDVAALQDSFAEIAERRGWRELHTPKNLAAAISVEAGELLALFQWLEPGASERAQLDSEQLAAAGSELADVMLYCLALCRRLELDPAALLTQKAAANQQRFLGPADD